jgi:RNA polymerase sigma factor (sigma-70 family)
MSAAVATRSSTNHSTTREQRILQHYPLVRTIAARMIRRFPSSVELDELVNVGTLGLIDAVDRFDPSRQVPFKAYAEIRIRGAIVDALRQADWVPRSVRRKYNRIEAARDKLFFDLDRARAVREARGRRPHQEAHQPGRSRRRRERHPPDRPRRQQGRGSPDDLGKRRAQVRDRPGRAQPPPEGADGRKSLLSPRNDAQGDRPGPGRDRVPRLPAAVLRHQAPQVPARSFR